MENAESRIIKWRHVKIVCVMKITDKKIKVIEENSERSDNFITTLISRIRTQRREATNYGGIGFDPPLICAVLRKYGNENIYKDWIENTLKSVYFCVGCRKVYLRDVEEIHLQKDSSNTSNIRTKVKIPVMLSQFKIPTVPHEMYRVKISFKSCFGKTSIKPINIGDKLNLATEINDLTLDHVIPIRRVLDDNKDKLPYLTKISYIKEISPSKKVADICNMIDFGDNNKKKIISGIQEELNLIVKKTHGLRICAMRVN